LGFYFEEAGDDGGGLLPVLSFGLEGFAAGLGEVVEAGAAIVLGGAPLGFDGAFLFEFEEDWVESALIDGEEIAADLLDAAGEAVAVERAEDVESFEDHEGEGSLEDVGFFYGRVVVGGGHFGFQQEDGMTPFGKQQGSFGKSGSVRRTGSAIFCRRGLVRARVRRRVKLRRQCCRG